MSFTMRALVAAFLVGLLLGGGAVAYVLPSSVTTSPTSSLGAATGCQADAPTEPVSWLVRVPDGDRTTFVFNRTFSHEEPSLRLEGSVEQPEPGEYVYRIDAAPDSDEKPAADCTPVTRLDAVVSVPSDYRTFSVVYDGDELVTVEKGDSLPAFVPVERANETA
ncbi:hypothetical protein SAMN04488063_0074 [Halopelagius inordinatus]|uniref:Uncharacterized protein n=1 Tax=Halopelagius inordinatus TaxID=553467 RepID=A0A1I2X046_9EURY|nr:hypothetical protein [Halopelagius inordinatus]SFH06883.1 hypothetical protein SAMN04488063_0074 [Halopelagius inordinatus]